MDKWNTAKAEIAAGILNRYLGTPQCQFECLGLDKHVDMLISGSHTAKVALSQEMVEEIIFSLAKGIKDEGEYLVNGMVALGIINKENILKNFVECVAKDSNRVKEILNKEI